jgi:hypothetical protein
MPSTARSHFDEDLARAWHIHTQARHAKESDLPLAEDLSRCVITFGVGALDAYLCDAFVDSLARAMKQCRRQKRPLPNGYAKLAIPAGPLLASYEARPNWAFRMAARAMMEKDNLLQLARLKSLFNPALPPNRKLWLDVVPQYVALDRKGLTGITNTEFQSFQGKTKTKARDKAAAAVLHRMGSIVQRRHNIVHNCDRRRTALEGVTVAEAKKMLRDIELFIVVLDEHLDAHRVY